MATEVFSHDVSIPAGTTQAAPAVIDVSFNPMITDSIEWSVPKGPSGLMGFRLTSGGAQVIPKNLGAWVVADGQSGTWQLEDMHDSGAWQVTAYNTGAFPHTIRVRFHVRPIGQRATSNLPFAWLQGGKLTAAMVEIGTLASAPESVRVPSSALWPPRGR